MYTIGQIFKSDKLPTFFYPGDIGYNGNLEKLNKRSTKLSITARNICREKKFIQGSVKYLPNFQGIFEEFIDSTNRNHLNKYKLPVLYGDKINIEHEDDITNKLVDTFNSIYHRVIFAGCQTLANKTFKTKIDPKSKPDIIFGDTFLFETKTTFSFNVATVQEILTHLETCKSDDPIFESICQVFSYIYLSSERDSGDSRNSLRFGILSNYTNSWLLCLNGACLYMSDTIKPGDLYWLVYLVILLNEDLIGKYILILNILKYYKLFNHFSLNHYTDIYIQ